MASSRGYLGQSSHMTPPRMRMRLPMIFALSIMLTASSVVASTSRSTSPSPSLTIHRGRECEMEQIWQTAFEDATATTIDQFFEHEAPSSTRNSGDAVAAAVWTRADTCGDQHHRNQSTPLATNCFARANVALGKGHTLTLRASASVSVAIQQPQLQTATNSSTTQRRLRVHALFPASDRRVSNATITLAIPHAALVASLSLVSDGTTPNVIHVGVQSTTHNLTLEFTPPCPLVDSESVGHIVDVAWDAQWIRWHFDGHALHEMALPVAAPATTSASASAIAAPLTVGLLLTSSSSSAPSLFRIQKLELQRVAHDQDPRICQPQAIDATATCRHGTNRLQFQPRLGDDQGYLSLAQVYTFIHDVPHRLPAQLTRVEPIGVSTENRSLVALCIGAACSPKASTSTIPQVLFTGMHHAREPISMMNLVYTIDLLVLDFANGDRATTTLLLSRQLWFVLVVNPDGYARNEALETWATRKSGQRKNARTGSESGCSRNKNDSGVDLNRNYDICFAEDAVGSSTDPCGEDYRGPAPFSEPETRAIKELVERKSSNFKVSLNYHSFGRYFNVPFACKAMDTPHGDDLRVYEDWAREMTRFNGFAYGQPWKDDNLYSVNGETSDWLWATHGIFAMSPEVGPAFATRVDQGFWPPREDVAKLSVELHYSNLVAARLAGPQYEVVVTKITRQPAAEQDTEKTITALLHVELQLQNRGLGTAGDVEIVLTTALQDDDLREIYTTVTRVEEASVGTVRSANASSSAQSLVIPETGVLHLVVRDALSCQYIRLTTTSTSTTATTGTSVAFQQWRAVEMPLCGVCRSLGRDATELQKLPPAPQWCETVDDLVTPEALSSVAIVVVEERNQADQVDLVDTEAPHTTAVVTPTTATTGPPPAITTTTPLSAEPEPASTVETTPVTTTLTPEPSPVDDQLSTAKTSSTSASSLSVSSVTSFVSVPILVTLFLLALVVVAVVLRRRRRHQHRGPLATNPRSSGATSAKSSSANRKNYVQVVNEDDDDDDGLEVDGPRARGTRDHDTMASDDEDAEYGRRRSPSRDHELV